MVMEDQHIEEHHDGRWPAAYEYGTCEEVPAPGTNYSQLHYLDVDTTVDGDTFHEGDTLHLRLSASDPTGLTAGTASFEDGASQPLYQVQKAQTEVVKSVVKRIPAKHAAHLRRMRYGLVQSTELLSEKAPAKMDILILRLNYTDDSPTYCNESCALNGLYSPSFERNGDPSVATMIKNSTYGKVELVPPTQIKVLTVDMGVAISTLSSCPYLEMAMEAERRAKAQFNVDPGRYSFREFFLPQKTPGCKGWAGLANVGCGAPSMLPSPGACRAWYRYRDVYVRAHELGHNLGLSHAAGLDIRGQWREYGDSMAVMGAHGRLIDFTAPSRHALGVLPESSIVRSTSFDVTPAAKVETCSESCKYSKDTICDDGGPGAEYTVCEYGTDCTDCGTRSLPPPSPPPHVKSTYYTLRSLDLPLSDARGDGVAIVHPCSKCMPKIGSYADRPGGEIWVSFRDKHHELGFANPYPNRVWVHLQREYKGAYGRGTEVWANLTAKEYVSISSPHIQMTVHVCSIEDDLASVTLGRTPEEAMSDCLQPPSPPPPLPPYPPGGAPPSPVPGSNQPFTVSTDIRASGQVADYGDARKAELIDKFALQASVNRDAVGLTVTAVTAAMRKAFLARMRRRLTLAMTMSLGQENSGSSGSATTTTTSSSSGNDGNSSVLPEVGTYVVRAASAAEVKLEFVVLAADAGTGENVQALLSQKLATAALTKSWLGVPTTLDPYVEISAGVSTAAKALHLKPDKQKKQPPMEDMAANQQASPASSRLGTDGSASAVRNSVGIGLLASAWCLLSFTSPSISQRRRR